MGSVFINYRRGETAGEARALFNELAATLGKDSVFMDVDNIDLGRDFRQVLRERLETCDLMLALIGKDWVDSRDASGRRRLEDVGDFVRMEIEAALKRNIPVTPVLVQGASMPSTEQLPEGMRDFAYRNGFELSHNRWESDVHEMFKRLGLGVAQGSGAGKAGAVGRKTPAVSPVEQVQGGGVDVPPAAQASRKSWLSAVAASAAAIALAGGGFLYYRSVAEDNARLLEQARDESAQAKAEAEARVAAAKAEAAQAAAAQAERERIAAAEAAKDRAAAVQAERERAAAVLAERERLAAAEAARDRAAAAQAERERIAAAREAKDRAAAQAEKERIAAAREAKDRAAAQAERERIAAGQTAKDRLEAQAEKDRAAAAAAARFSGSLAVSLGEYARSRGLKQSELTIRNTFGVCGKWSQDLQLDADDSRSFRTSCMKLADFANANDWQLGARPTPQQWMGYCSATAGVGQLSGDLRKRFIAVCLKSR